MRWRLMAYLFTLVVLAPHAAHAGEFMDTRITFAISDGNLLQGPGQSNPNSPAPSFIPGSRANLFFDNYNTRFSGFESLSHAVLYKKLPSFFKGLTTEAALVIRMLYRIEKANAFFQMQDAGSYIQLTYDFDDDKSTKRNISLVTFPISSNRFQLGYSFRIAWGGNSAFPRRTVVAPVPGMKLQFTYDFKKNLRFFIFSGIKTTFLQKSINSDLIEEETAIASLSGLGFRVGGFQIEGGFGYVDKGTFSNTGVRGEPINFYGGAGQISFVHGMPIGVSIDFRLYRNDPDRPIKFFKPEKYTPGKFSMAVSSEFSYVVNMLQDADTLTGIKAAPGVAGDLNFRMKYGYFRLHADVMYRDLGFILKDVPGFVPFQTFTEDQIARSINPELFFAIGVDYYFKAAHLTVGLKGGVQFPAYFKGFLPPEVTGNNPTTSLQGDQIIVIRDEGDISLLPVKDAAGNDVEVLPVISAKLNFKWQLSSFLVAVGEVLFSVDNNQTRFQDSTEDGTVGTREFLNPIIFGFNLMLQARF